MLSVPSVPLLVSQHCPVQRLSVLLSQKGKLIIFEALLYLIVITLSPLFQCHIVFGPQQAMCGTCIVPQYGPINKKK